MKKKVADLRTGRPSFSFSPDKNIFVAQTLLMGLKRPNRPFVFFFFNFLYFIMTDNPMSQKKKEHEFRASKFGFS